MFFNALPGLKDELIQVSKNMERMLPPEWNRGVVGEIIEAVLAGRGKGYRPSLLLLMGRLGPDYPTCNDRLCRLGALVEFVHIASLIHDDIVDDSALRRGNPTIQARFGKDMAVYAGDMILGQVLSVLLKENLHDSGILIAQTVQDMCRGEIAQSACRYRTDLSEEEYYQNIYGKTASMFVTVCKIGGLESGCSKAVVDKLGQLGLHLGYLFQIRDDLLDFIPENSEDGKPVRMDFQEGILTLPVLYALKKPEYRLELEELVLQAKVGSLTNKQLDRLDELISEAGGFEAAKRAADNHRRNIEEILSSLSPCKTIEVVRHLISLLKLPDIMLSG